MIIHGELAPGERLVEGQLAERLGVSRNPVREAIRSLEATGLVEVTPRKGAYVCVINREQVRQIQELRLIVEGYAVSQAALTRTEDDLTLLHDCLSRGPAAPPPRAAPAAAIHHRDFHRAVERAAGNPFLEQVINPLRQQTELVFSVVVDARGDITWTDHQAIYDAVAAGDSDVARKLMREHITNALETFERAAGNTEIGAAG